MTNKYPKVPKSIQNTQKYIKVRGTKDFFQKHRKILKLTYKYPKVPKSTNKYSKVHRSKGGPQVFSQGDHKSSQKYSK